MRYLHDRRQSGEIFRQALQHMQEQKAAFTPPHLAIWYEFSANLNPPLASVLNQKREAKEPLSDEDVWHLFGRHVAGRDVEAFEACQTKLRRVVGDTASEAQAAIREADALMRTLAGTRDRIKSTGQTEVLEGLEQRIASFVGFLQGFSQTLTLNQAQAGSILETLERSQTEPLRDALTGLPNMAGFHRAIDALGLPNGELTGWVLLIVDIDRFKVINDSFGHLMGDKAIASVAEVLRGSAKASEIVARLWGEEFAILVPSGGGSRPVELAETIRARVAALEIKSPTGRIGRVTVSIGVAVAFSGEKREQLFHRADAAMYASKHRSRNRVTVWKEGLEGERSERDDDSGVD